MAQIKLVLDDKTHAEFKAQAALRRMSMQALLAEFIQNLIAKAKEKK
jgi:hypothetical protein